MKTTAAQRLEMLLATDHQVTPNKPKAPKGFILYQGPSMLDGEPIVVIATLETSNRKTGNMVQTWIIRSDMSPVEVSNQGLDESVCGGCPHRWSLGGACYVNIGQAPGAIYRAFIAGKYPAYDKSKHEQYLLGREIRFGAYGDPAAAPVNVWHTLANLASATTGYTHQASHPKFDKSILDYCMVSADTPKQALKIQGKELRTFRVKTADAPALPGEIECLSDSKGLTCQECQLCSSSTDQGPSIYINAHGSRVKRYESKYSAANLIPLVAA